MADIVQQFYDISMQLVSECIEYAKGGVFIEETDANIRRVRVVTQVLMSALQQAQIPRPFNMQGPPQQASPPHPHGG